MSTLTEVCVLTAVELKASALVKPCENCLQWQQELHAWPAVQLWALPEVRALTAKELEASTLEEPEEDAEEAQADAAAADKAEEVRVGANPEVTSCHELDQASVSAAVEPGFTHRFVST